MRGMLEGRWSNELQKEDLPADFGNRMVQHHAPSDNFPAENGRYYLYASYACPWAHLTILARTLLGLEDSVPLIATDPWLDPLHGWWFPNEEPLQNKKFLHELYALSDSNFTGRVTVPVLWDSHTRKIVQNYSTGIMRIFEFGFTNLRKNDRALLPKNRAKEIHQESVRILEDITYRVYDVGHSSTQTEYEKNLNLFYDALDKYDQRLRTQSYLLGEELSECDLRFFVTLIRFDCAYYGVFLCNYKRVAEYPALQAYLERIYALPHIAGTVRFDEIRTHYFDDDAYINRSSAKQGRYIVPVGPQNPIEQS